MVGENKCCGCGVGTDGDTLPIGNDPDGKDFEVFCTFDSCRLEYVGFTGPMNCSAPQPADEPYVPGGEDKYVFGHEIMECDGCGTVGRHHVWCRSCLRPKS